MDHTLMNKAAAAAAKVQPSEFEGPWSMAYWKAVAEAVLRCKEEHDAES
jgi:hypothetical protein